MRLRHLTWNASKGMAAVTSAGHAQYPSHAPPLAPRDEAWFLLNIAAEIEHALMVQYLYAAYSLDPDGARADQRDTVIKWRLSILEIAREEMGHLATVQNLLRLIGAPLTLERDEFPFGTPFYPFEFQLEPLSIHSLAKYVVAEMPPGLSGREITTIRRQARDANRGKSVNRVGALYRRLRSVFGQINATDLAADSAGVQARDGEWRLGYPRIIVLGASDKKSALAAIDAISEQGEGIPAPKPAESIDPDSHFARFLTIYRQFAKSRSAGLVAPVPTHPNLQEGPWQDKNMEAGRFTNPTAKLWAQLGNKRYRMLLMFLTHALHLEAPVNRVEQASPRGLLLTFCFGEMYNLRSLAAILSKLKLKTGGGRAVGALPFELPFSTRLSEREIDRWRLHRDLLSAALKLAEQISSTGSPSTNAGEFLTAIQATDRAALRDVENMIAQLAPRPAVGVQPVPINAAQPQSQAMRSRRIVDRQQARRGAEDGTVAHSMLAARRMERYSRRRSAPRPEE